MGEIKKQSIVGTIFVYGGALLGFLTSGILFPRFLSTEQIGLIGVLVSYSAIFAQVASFGFVSATTRMFPYFRDESKKHNGFVFLGISVALAGFVIVSLGFWLLEPYIINNSSGNSELLEQYSLLIYPLSFFVLFFNFHDHYNKVLFNASRGIILKEFFLRIVIIVFIIILVLKFINFDQFVHLYVLCYAFPLIAIVFLLAKEGQLSYKPKKGLIEKSLIKPTVSVSLYGIITSATGQISINIDRIMVESYLGLDQAGVYLTCFFFGTLVILPSRAILKISAAYISDAFKKNDLKLIRDIYYKTSINQFIVGVLMVIGLLVNQDNIFHILGYDYLSGRYVILFISLAYLTDMLAGASARVINNSEYYKKQGLFMVIFVLLIVISNMVLIPIYGITGAAFATLGSKIIFHTIKFIFIYKKFEMQPYTSKYFLIVAIGAVSFAAGYFTPTNDSLLIDIGLRSTVTATIFLSLTYIFNVSADINQSLLNLKRKFF